jgi:very-short-patch-repair endonuclease
MGEGWVGVSNLLEDQGYRVLRFWNHEVLSNRQGVYERIVRDLR